MNMIKTVRFANPNFDGKDLFDVASEHKGPIVRIRGSRHNFIYAGGFIKIGCEQHTVKWWLKNYYQMGLDHSYSTREIEEYRRYIKAVADLRRRVKK